MKTTGHKIKRMREIRGISQKDIADAIGLSVNQYGKIERDESNLTVDRLEQIAKALNVTPEDILNFDELHSVVINNPSYCSTNILNKEVVNNSMPEKLIQLFEDKIKLLEEKIVLLESKLKK